MVNRTALKRCNCVPRRCPYCRGNQKYNNQELTRHQDSQECQRNGRRRVSYAPRYLRNPFPFDDVLTTQFAVVGNPTDGVVATRDGFLLHFDRERMVTKFTYEYLSAANAIFGAIVPYRGRRWVADLDLPLDCIYTRHRISPRPNGFQLGHLCTCALHQHDDREKVDNILMSAGCLQHEVVNQGALKVVEQNLNCFLNMFSIHVFSGCIMDSNPNQLSVRIDEELQITIPDYIYKVFAFRLFGEHYYYEGYRFRNSAECPMDPEESRVTIDVLRAATQLNFFHRIPATHLHTKTNATTTLTEIMDNILA